MNDPIDPIGALIRRAGPREPVSPERLHRLRASAHAEWRARADVRLRQRAITRSLIALGVAALLIVAVRLVTSPREAAPLGPAVVATVDLVVGPAHLLAPHLRSPVALVRGAVLRDGDVVQTADGLVSVRLTSGALVRINRSTRVRLVGSSALQLDHGATYVDSGGVHAASATTTSIEVRTPFGLARDIGTRFAVEVGADALTVRVRDGLVQVSQRGVSHDVRPRDEVRLSASGHVQRRTIDTFGDAWMWTTAVARPFALEGRSLSEFLDWVVEETGWQVRFLRSEDERRASSTRLHGSIDGLTPEQAITVVLPASGVEHTLANGTLTIERLATASP